MSDEREDPRTPEERAARDAVRTLPHERAGDAFRTRLRHEFTTGRIGRRRERVPARPWFLRPAVLAPFAAGIALALVLQANRGPDWRLLAATGEGRVWVGERSFAPADTVALALALRRGGQVRIEGALTLDVAAPGVIAVMLGPDGAMTLPAAPNRLWGRRMEAKVEAGDSYFTTGRAFQGAALEVMTPEARVHAVGTAFAVLRHEFGTCVCVMEGHVHVGVAGASEMADVREGMRRTVGRDGSVEDSPILDDSVHRLHAQRSRWGATIGR
jgi:ferric-dicitrate binding protein FerR (iron transport regulator)